MNYTYVQALAKQRSQIINDFLEETMANFPDEMSVDLYPFARRVAILLEKFFLTDHCESLEEGAQEEDRFGKLVNTPIQKKFVPRSKKRRESVAIRNAEEHELANAKSLRVDEEELQQSTTSQKKTSPVVSILLFVDEKPLMVVAVFAGAMQVLKIALPTVIPNTLLVGFVCFCLGMQSLRMAGVEKQGSKGVHISSAGTLMPQSISAGGAEATEAPRQLIESPMPRFPEGAKLGSALNCWSDPPSTNFKVRGDKYLKDKKKIESGPCLFPNRGIDLFLTDACPENVGSIPTLMNGELRNVPTFIINFRLPWGVLLFYFEIPERFIPFIKGCYGDDSVNKSELEQQMKDMSNCDRCCARFLMGDENHKNNTLKIFPGIVEGPWVVKASVGGKPAIIGTKLPVNYVYQPEGTAVDGSKQALYLEADLDIVSSSAARGVLSVVRSYTQVLTLDLGFAVQGNSEDELPECMLTGVRIHGIDPLHAPPLPPMKDVIFGGTNADGADEDDEE